MADRFMKPQSGSSESTQRLRTLIAGDERSIEVPTVIARGWDYSSDKEYDRARNYFQLVVDAALSGEILSNAEACYGIGHVSDRIGNSDEALECLALALDIYPEQDDYYSEALKLYKQRGRYLDAADTGQDRSASHQ